MELKYIKFTAKTYGVVSSNRTFMELKFPIFQCLPLPLLF